MQEMDRVVAELPETALPNETAVDRRDMLLKFGLGMGALLAGAGPALAQSRESLSTVNPAPAPQPVPLCTTSTSNGLPSHLTNTDPWDPDAFPTNAWNLLRAMGNECVDDLVNSLGAFLTANKTLLETSHIVYLYNEADKYDTLPTTIAGTVALFLKGLDGSVTEIAVAAGVQEGSLCIEGPEDCIDVGCGDIPGWCWSVPALIQELGVDPCSCVRKPKWYEVALAVLILGILILTPGPDEIAGIMATIGRLIVTRVPVPVA